MPERDPTKPNDGKRPVVVRGGHTKIAVIDTDKLMAELANLVEGVWAERLPNSNTKIVHIGDQSYRVCQFKSLINPTIEVSVSDIDLAIARMAEAKVKVDELKELPDGQWLVRFWLAGGCLPMHFVGERPSQAKKKCAACAAREADNNETMRAATDEQRDGG